DGVRRQLGGSGRGVTRAPRAPPGQGSNPRPAERLLNIVTLASMVEREVNQASDRLGVCEVYYNRLARNMALQVDATVLYGLGKWQTTVTQADLTKDTPYNTYLHNDLHPTPVSHPRLS